jgi:hypothetical protein
MLKGLASMSSAGWAGPGCTGARRAVTDV